MCLNVWFSKIESHIIISDDTYVFVLLGSPPILDSIKLKEYVKPKGRPKHTSKNKKRGRGKENQSQNAGLSIPKPKCYI